MELVPGNDDVRVTNPGVKLTYDDFVLFPDDGKRHELIDGEHYVTPSPNLKHQKVSGNIHLLIGGWLEQHPVGQVYYAPFDVVFRRSTSSSPICSICRTNGPRKC
jgi:Uma2 family endonuclease